MYDEQSGNGKIEKTGSTFVRNGAGVGADAYYDRTSVDGSLRTSSRGSVRRSRRENSEDNSTVVYNRTQGEELCPDHGISDQNSFSGEVSSRDHESRKPDLPSTFGGEKSHVRVVAAPVQSNSTENLSRVDDNSSAVPQDDPLASLL